MSQEGKAEWFGGNQDALDLYRMFIEVAHTWDDLVDRDKPVSNDQINRCFQFALVDIPANPVYQLHFMALRPLLLTAIASYQVANQYEADKDAHGLELAHTLRYAVSQVFIYLVTVYAGGDKAQEILPEALKQMMCERLFVYLKEHHYEPAHA